MKKFKLGFVDGSMSKKEERELVIELFDEGCFWLNNVFCNVCSIERNSFHYFINYKDRIGDNVPIKQLVVATLKEDKSE